MLPATLRLLLSVSVATLVLYYVLKHFSAPKGGAKKLKRRKDPAERKPVKGVAPHKIDIFTTNVCAAFPEMSVDAARRLFPRKFEVHGHVVVIRLNDGTSVEELRPLARFFAESFAPVLVHVVLLDVDGIVGELRRPSLQILFQADTALTKCATSLRRTVQRRWGDARKRGQTSCMTIDAMESTLNRWTASPTFTAHVENGVIYSFDVSRVMFSSGNTTERMHFGTVTAADEVVVDMFCGIGYFTLPLAMHGNVAAIHALEKNPDSIDFLKLNAVLNKVDHLIRPVCGDNREVGEELLGKCDRVLMGYIPTCKSFLPRALSFLKRNEAGRSSGVVHYHLLADKLSAAQEALRDVQDELGEEVAAFVRITDLRCVKSYAPKRFHFVADLVFE
ncbi:conserved hypothetical protein [Leishmania infantum JPCM5]|uniref:Met-10+_like-protein/Methyltransferase_small_domain /Methyltransferase_domain_containing_protein_-_putative n=3 Tax=Leishmania donovani species complex TaxID=38574 RepID=A0A6L0WGZ3_LEIIN|nr:conserved hypothetical protein [Leishmania infantum JPCM5]XP_003857971.1 hypothetical protein, conserved [Leishmania donovani]CAC9438615.1 Met-10+_like-protein/Methyltransferase_small_domain /Methyltransferase_domain_containing_protein_-_putative [Leishmania infantum]AYU75681.1 Met-10+ like-protein/Methyltransferase small domain/Methyltransferase domain containing protein, putative [Leishmania donovani]TPP53963.1 Met-10+ like-family protein [Leishmania donovani]CBZ08309.1 conserved hypothet|eukprot:XP_003392177.1 conserved hypothetical protein [Leishmania infantum JPCM5]